MSGGISFKSGEYWSAAGWAYRAVLDSLCEELSHDDSYALFEELASENGPARVIEFIEMEDWTIEKLVFFCSALEKAYDHTMSKGPIGWRDPSAFEGFIIHYEKLAKLAEKERREYSGKIM